MNKLGDVLDLALERGNLIAEPALRAHEFGFHEIANNAAR